MFLETFLKKKGRYYLRNRVSTNRYSTFRQKIKNNCLETNV